MLICIYVYVNTYIYTHKHTHMGMIMCLQSDRELGCARPKEEGVQSRWPRK